MAMAPLQTPVDDGGFPLGGVKTVVVAAGASGVIKAGPGRLCRVLVTGASPTAALTFFDNPAAAAGTVIGVVPAGSATGQAFDIRMPAAAGIFASGGAGSAAVTVLIS